MSLGKKIKKGTAVLAFSGGLGAGYALTSSETVIHERIEEDGDRTVIISWDSNPIEETLAVLDQLMEPAEP